MNPYTAVLYLTCAAALLCGCANPGARIKKNPQMYAGLSPDVQENVQKGRIDIGYSRDAVFLALGNPSRQYERRTAAGATVVWSYVDRDFRTSRERVHGSFRIRDSEGHFRTVHDDVWVEVQHEIEYESMRVEFQNDVVEAIEESAR